MNTIVLLSLSLSAALIHLHTQAQQMTLSSQSQSVCVLTEVSQAGQSRGLKHGVVGKSPTGSHGDPLHAVEHQDVEVTL